LITHSVLPSCHMRANVVTLNPEGVSHHSPGLPLRLPWDYGSQHFYPERAGLPRCAAVSLNYCLPGFTTNPFARHTDVTQCFSDVHRAEPDLRHGPCGVGESFP